MSSYVNIKAIKLITLFVGFAQLYCFVVVVGSFQLTNAFSDNNYNNCSIVSFPLMCSMFKHPFIYITEPHKTIVSFLSQNLSKWTPVLINKIWYYKMHKESSQVNSEQILTLYFRCPSFSANHLF